MQSQNYKGAKSLRATAASIGATIEGPFQMGVDWWATVTMSNGTPFTGTVREVNAYLMGRIDAARDVRLPKG